MAEVGSEEGSIEEGEKELIHSIFEFGDTIVREVMVPRPDIVAIEDDKTLRDVQALVLSHGYSRIPVFHGSLDDVKGVVFAKDVLKALHQGRRTCPRRDRADGALRAGEQAGGRAAEGDAAREVPPGARVRRARLRHRHRRARGPLEELVGEIADEYDREEPEVLELGDGIYRVSGKASIDDVNELLGTELPDEEWDTVAGLMLDLFGRMPETGEEVAFRGLSLKTDKVQGRRIASVLITRSLEENGEQPEVAT